MTLDDLVADLQRLAELWKRAALLQDRTRRVIRERHRAGDAPGDICRDYGVPEAFVTHLCAWQLFGDEP